MSLVVRIILEVTDAETGSRVALTERGDTVVPVSPDPDGWLALVLAALASGIADADTSMGRTLEDLVAAEKTQ